MATRSEDEKRCRRGPCTYNTFSRITLWCIVPDLGINLVLVPFRYLSVIDVPLHLLNCFVDGEAYGINEGQGLAFVRVQLII